MFHDALVPFAERRIIYMTLLMREREKYKEGIIEGRIEGRFEGVVNTCKDFNLSMQETVKYLIDNFGLSFQEAEKIVGEYWN